MSFTRKDGLQQEHQPVIARNETKIYQATINFRKSVNHILDIQDLDNRSDEYWVKNTRI